MPANSWSYENQFAKFAELVNERSDGRPTPPGLETARPGGDSEGFHLVVEVCPIDGANLHCPDRPFPLLVRARKLIQVCCVGATSGVREAPPVPNPIKGAEATQ